MRCSQLIPLLGLLVAGSFATTAVAEPSQVAESFDPSEVAELMSALLGADSDVAAFESSLTRLEEAGKAFTPQDAETTLTKLKEKETSIKDAEKEFDKLIEDIRKSQALGDPDGEFVKLLNDAKRAAEKEAQAARADGSDKFAESFETLAVELAVIRDRAIQARNDAIPAIDYIKLNKKDYVRAKKLRAFAELAVIADNAVEKVEAQSREAREAAAQLQSALEGGVTP